MIDGDTQTETTTEAEGADDATLLTEGEQRQPDKGPGDKEPDKGPGEKEASEAEGDETESEEQTGAPEVYEDFAVAEGVELNTEILDEFKATAKELNLSQDGAQKLVDSAVKLQDAFVKAQADAIIEVRGQWKTASETDPEIGGDKLAENLATAKRALNAFGSEDFGKMLDETGLGNHPEVIRFLAKAGATVSEDKIVTGKTRTQTPADIADRLYGKKE